MQCNNFILQCKICNNNIYSLSVYPWVLDTRNDHLAKEFPQDFIKGHDYQIFFCSKECVEVYKLNPTHLLE